MNASSSPPSPVEPASRKRLWLQTAKVLVAILVSVGLVLAIRSGRASWAEQRERVEALIRQADQKIASAPDEVQRRELVKERQVLQRQRPVWTNLRLDRLAAAGLLYALGLLPAAVILRLNCGRLGPQPRWSTSVAAQLLGHVGKYVPGKAMVVVLRVGVLRRDNVNPMVATVSIFVETFMMMAVGAVIAGLITWMMPVPRWVRLTAIVMAVTASLPTVPPILRRIVERVSKHQELDDELARFDSRWFLNTWMLSLCSWLVIGAAFMLVVSAMPGAVPLPDAPTLYVLSTASIGLALVAGFASLLPGGAGVRELVLATILGVALDPSRGLLAAIAMRLLSILVEAILAFSSWIWLRVDAAKLAKIESFQGTSDE